MHETARKTSYCKSTEILEIVTRNFQRTTDDDDDRIVGVDAIGNIIVHRDDTIKRLRYLRQRVRVNIHVSRNVEPRARQIMFLYKFTQYRRTLLALRV